MGELALQTNKQQATYKHEEYNQTDDTGSGNGHGNGHINDNGTGTEIEKGLETEPERGYAEQNYIATWNSLD